MFCQLHHENECIAYVDAVDCIANMIVTGMVRVSDTDTRETDSDSSGANLSTSTDTWLIGANLSTIH